jgi:hypothetical protein
VTIVGTLARPVLLVLLVTVCGVDLFGAACHFGGGALVLLVVAGVDFLPFRKVASALLLVRDSCEPRSAGATGKDEHGGDTGRERQKVGGAHS